MKGRDFGCAESPYDMKMDGSLFFTQGGSSAETHLSTAIFWSLVGPEPNSFLSCYFVFVSTRKLTMAQDKRADHDSALDDRVSHPGRDAEDKRGQGVDEGGAIHERSDSDNILDSVHDRPGGISDEEVGRYGFPDLLDGQVHGDVASLEQRLGVDLLVVYDTLSNLAVNNIG